MKIYQNPKKMLLILLSGFLCGVLLISLGWAQTARPLPKKAFKAKPAAHKMVAKKPVAIKKVPKPAAPAPLLSYTHPEGNYELRYPRSWRITARDNAMIAKVNHGEGVFGILRRPDDQPNEEAIDRELQSQSEPGAIRKVSARVAGMPATKLIGPGKEDPNTRMVEYYVQNFDGKQYYVLLKAPRAQWDRYNAAFTKMLSNLTFF
jgi:hypothetical protein